MAQLPFSPGKHGFLFNNTWSLDELDKMRYRRILTLGGLLNLSVLVRGSRSHRTKMKWGRAAFLQLILIWVYRQLNSYKYGLCGGLSFTELDYYRLDQPVPLPSLTIHPAKHDPAEYQLRSYIWKRTLDSLRLNTFRVLVWMYIGHFYPLQQQWLKEKTRIEIEKLKNIINAGMPWPICLIGTTLSPFYNHQVLAVGYEEHDNWITLSVHDSNCPDRLSQISLDFSSSALVIWESCSSKRRGPTRGIFGETYHFSQPPLLKTDR